MEERGSEPKSDRRSGRTWSDPTRPQRRGVRSGPTVRVGRPRALGRRTGFVNKDPLPHPRRGVLQTRVVGPLPLGRAVGEREGGTPISGSEGFTRREQVHGLPGSGVRGGERPHPRGRLHRLRDFTSKQAGDTSLSGPVRWRLGDIVIATRRVGTGNTW